MQGSVGTVGVRLHGHRRPCHSGLGSGAWGLRDALAVATGSGGEGQSGSDAVDLVPQPFRGDAGGLCKVPT